MCVVLRSSVVFALVTAVLAAEHHAQDDLRAVEVRANGEVTVIRRPDDVTGEPVENKDAVTSEAERNQARFADRQPRIPEAMNLVGNAEKSLELLAIAPAQAMVLTEAERFAILSQDASGQAEVPAASQVDVDVEVAANGELIVTRRPEDFTGEPVEVKANGEVIVMRRPDAVTGNDFRDQASFTDVQPHIADVLQLLETAQTPPELLPTVPAHATLLTVDESLAILSQDDGGQTAVFASSEVHEGVAPPDDVAAPLTQLAWRLSSSVIGIFSAGLAQRHLCHASRQPRDWLMVVD